MDEFASLADTAPEDGLAEAPEDGLAEAPEDGPEEGWDDPQTAPPPQDPWDEPEQPSTTESPGAAPPPSAGDRANAPQPEPGAPVQGEDGILAALLKHSAQRQGLTAEDYLTGLRQQELTALGLSPEGAAAQARAEQEAAASTLKAQAQAARDGRQQAEFRAFLKAFPQIDPKGISPDVWAAVGKGEPLLTAYLKQENEALKTQLAALRQQGENERRALGSRQDRGGALGSDSFLTGFFSE